MNKPNEASVELFVDDSPESQRALIIFAEAGIQFMIMTASGPSVPGVRLGNQYYPGISEVEAVARSMREAAASNANGA